ncbi:MAG: hypothetical protein ACXWFP_20285 [Methylobacter sp.]
MTFSPPSPFYRRQNRAVRLIRLFLPIVHQYWLPSVERFFLLESCRFHETALMPYPISQRVSMS